MIQTTHNSTLTSQSLNRASELRDRNGIAPADVFSHSLSAAPLQLIPRNAVIKSPSEEGLTGRILHRGDPGWKDACINFAGRVDQSQVEPKTILFAQNPQDVKNAVNWARENGVPFRVRCGRHSYEAYSLVKDGLVIDVSDMNQIQLDASNGQVTVGSGCRVHDIAEALAAQGRVMPLPTFPSVGISGATLGGGVGMTSRKLGLTCDNLLSAQVVTADGELITASADENPELLWALKGGGGGNFGVVTSFTFQTHPVQNVAVFDVSWDWSKFDQLVDAWQHWAPQADDNITPALCLRADGRINMYGQYTPDSDAELGRCQEALQQLFAQCPPDKVSVNPVPPAIASRIFGQLDPSDGDWRKSLRKEQVFKSTSAIAFKPMPKEAIAKLRSYLENSPKQPGETNYNEDMVQLLPGGGASARKGVNETGVYHRKATYVLQYDAYWDHPAEEKVNTDWVEGMRDGMLEYASGAYVNYHDGLLQDPLVAYYGPNLPRLAEIKQKYDPNNVFNYPQSIPVKLSPEQIQAALNSAPMESTSA